MLNMARKAKNAIIKALERDGGTSAELAEKESKPTPLWYEFLPTELKSIGENEDPFTHLGLRKRKKGPWEEEALSEEE